MLEIKNLHASVDDKEILKGIDLKVNAGEVHAIMGPNGSGKSTLAEVIAGKEEFEVGEGSIFWKGKISKSNPRKKERRTVFSFHFNILLKFQGFR